jgi:hypothetical protein
MIPYTSNNADLTATMTEPPSADRKLAMVAHHPVPAVGGLSEHQRAADQGGMAWLGQMTAAITA